MHKHDWENRKSEIMSHSQARMMGGGQSLPRSQRTAVRADGCVCPLQIHPEGSIISKQECVHVWELQVVAGVSACLHQSVESTQRRPQLQKKPTSPCLLCSSEFVPQLCIQYFLLVYLYIFLICAKCCTSPSDK